MEKKPILYGVGVGPGDPQLLTVKAVEIIRNADRIAYPRHQKGHSLAAHIARPFIPEKTPEIPIQIPITHTENKAHTYHNAAQILIPYLKQNLRIAYLCEGDPLFYGSFIHIMHHINPYAEIRIIPGINTLSATAAAAQIPIATRNDILTVIPATNNTHDIERILEKNTPCVVMKVGRHFDRIADILKKNNRSQHALVIENASRETQNIYPLDKAPKGEKPYFSTLLIYEKQENL